MKRRPRARLATPTAQDAAVLCQAIHTLGNYGHVTVRAERGHLTIFADAGPPVARCTPLGAGQFGLSFRTHTGRWEPMPFLGDLTSLADAIVTALAPYLQQWDFPDRNSGSDLGGSPERQ